MVRSSGSSRRWPRLRSLDLSDTGVTDAGIQGIEGLTQLRELNLGDTAVGDAGLDRLKGLEQLQLLVLYGTKVTDEGVSRLQRAIPKCEIHADMPRKGPGKGRKVTATKSGVAGKNIIDETAQSEK